MTSSNIPQGFLRGPPPSNATVHKIDFEKTNPPVPAFKNRFAAVIDNLLSEEECNDLLRFAQESILPENETSENASNEPNQIWERAMINIGGGRQILSVDSRNCGRIIFDSPDLAQRILDRLMPYMKEWDLEHITNMPLATGLRPVQRKESFHLSRLNERMRFLRYEGGDYFRPHSDGCYFTPDGKERSLFTIHLYLNGEGEQDMQELNAAIRDAEGKEALRVGEDGEIDLMAASCNEKEEETHRGLAGDRPSEQLLGGATSFTDNLRGDDAFRVFPRTGSVLVFQQRGLTHSGDDVFRGVKYTMRSDVMYRMSAPGPESY